MIIHKTPQFFNSRQMQKLQLCSVSIPRFRHDPQGKPASTRIRGIVTNLFHLSVAIVKEIRYNISGESHLSEVDSFMQAILDNLLGNLTDFLIYTATAIVALVGLFKCVFPMTRAAGRLRRAVRRLEATAGEVRPVWQDVLFLGKEMQHTWRRFLVNAEQLDARGLNCNVEDYVNDDTVIYSVNHAQLAEIVPGLLTSLGILGTFIGLVRGLSGLDLSDAAKTIESIPQMIGGMAFAFTTSLVGVSCSLIFNILSRIAYGRATRAVDTFNEAFTELVMQRPLDDNVQLICQQEDRSAVLRHLSTDVSTRVSEGIVSAVERTLTPVAQSMNQFILGQTKAQLDGVDKLVTQILNRMNDTLNGQFLQLGQTLSAINQAQGVSYESMDRTMAAADRILSALSGVQDVTMQVMQRFDGYINTLEQAQESSGAFMTHGSQVLSGLMTASQEQSQMLERLRMAQQQLEDAMKDYAAFSEQMIGTAEKRSYESAAAADEASRKLSESSRLLSDSYSRFVDNMTGGFSKALGMFDESVHGVMGALEEKLEELRRVSEASPDNDGLGRQADGCAAALSQLQRTVTELNAALMRGTEGR